MTPAEPALHVPHANGGARGAASDGGGPAALGPRIEAMMGALRGTFEAGRTRPLAWRLAQLDGIRRLLVEREGEVLDALAADLGKSRFEGTITEVAYTLAEVDHLAKKLASWLRPERVPMSLLAQPGKSYVVREPLGVVLVMSAWNYPIMLALIPLAGAVAAGNAAVVKPSEVAPHTSRLLAARLPEYLDPGAVRVWEGGVPETTALLAERFDHIFYTGNGHVGRVVMTAAARHLTPVTLELGGKSPAIVDATADLTIAARRIAWSKFTNAGQTCVAPDYVLAEASIKPALLAKLGEELLAFYGPDPEKSPDFGRIVNARHHRRLAGLLGSGKVVHGGQLDEAARYIAPTIVDEPAPDSPLMSDEIFGPILPVLGVPSVDDAIRFINRRDKPLALYVFSSDAAAQQAVVARTSSGAVTINHGFLHMSVPGLPFGGVGPSGMGAYHGKRTLDTFSHQKAVLQKGTAIDPPLPYPPFSETKLRWLRRLL